MTLPQSGETAHTLIDPDTEALLTSYHVWNEDALGNTRPSVEGCPDLRISYVDTGKDRSIQIVEEGPSGDKPAQPEHVQLVATAIKRSLASDRFTK